MATPEPPSEQRELDLIDKLEFRIILNSNKEDKLQDTLDRYLKALLLKAESPHAAVRTKTVEVVQKINQYIKPPGIVLPVKALVEQFKTTSSALLKHLDLVFIQHSVPRLNSVERRDLFPLVTKGFSKESYPQNAASLFNIILRLLVDLKIPSRGSSEDIAFRETLGLDDAQDATVIADWIGKLMILTPTAETPEKGITKEDYDFLTCHRGAQTWNTDSDGGPAGLALPATRVLAVNLLSTGAFKDDERFFPALWATGSQDIRVSSTAEAILKRSEVSVEDPEMVAKLFDMHDTASRPVRTRVLEALSKSAASTSGSFAQAVSKATEKNMAELKAFYDARSAAAAEAASTGPQAKRSEVAVARQEHVKLASATLQYLSWTARMANIGNKDGKQLGMGPLFSIFQFLESQGWPVPHKTSREDDSLRGQIYETLGSLVRSAKLTDEEQVSWAQKFFKSLAEDPTAEVVVSIEGALSSMGPQFLPIMEHFQKIEKDDDVAMTGMDVDTSDMRATLRSYMNLDETQDGNGVVRNTRYAVTKFANSSLAPDDVEARWLDILAVAGRPNERSDVVEEGRRGLDLWNQAQRFGGGGKAPLASWDRLANFMFDMPESDGSSSVLESRFLDADFHGQRNGAVPVALNYCQNMFLAKVMSDIKIDQHWETQLETRLRNNPMDRTKVRDFTVEIEKEAGTNWESLNRIHLAAVEGTLRLSGKAQEECATALVDLISVSCVLPQGNLATKLLPLIKSTSDATMRNAVARAVGIVGTQASVAADDLQNHIIQPLMKIATVEGAIGSDQNAVEGCLKTLGHVLANRKYSVPVENIDQETMTTLDTLCQTWDIERLQPAMKAVALDMLSDSWTAGIPIGLAKVTEENKVDSASADAMIAKLLPDIKKKREKAIKALGRLCIVITPDLCTDLEATASKAMNALLDLTDIKEVEVHLAIGEALAVSAARWDSTSVTIGLDVGVNNTTLPTKEPTRVRFLLDKLLEVAKTTKPSVLRAYGIWLFSLIQYCWHLEEVRSHFRECQGVFMRLLSARDEMVQETASRGLSLVYEKGTEEVRKILVTDLTAVFTGDAKDKMMKVGEETEVFSAGDLETQDGKSITSYKDVVNLASEAGDPSLVYKLMNMSLHAATWSTRSAFGRFGLGQILSEAPLPASLYPKLFRYRFDPISSVRKSMSDIWKAAVRDSGEIVDQHFTLIMTDLLSSLYASEWRTREASCGAIADLVSGRPFKDYEEYYQDIWTRAAKVLDDKKSTVRDAALKLCMSLSKTLVTQLEDGSNSTSVVSMLSAAIPFLLSEKALGSNVKEVFAVSATTVVKIAKHGGKTINPFVPTMVEQLLGVMGTQEAPAINYMRNAYGEKAGKKIDAARSTLATKSPLWEAIENCLRHADGPTVALLIPILETTIKSSIALPTKIGCSNLIVALVSRHADGFRPHVASILKLMRKQVLDKNEEVAAAYARSTGYLLKLAKPRSSELLINHLSTIYFSSESEAPRQNVANVLAEIAKQAPDQFRKMETLVLPLVFVGMHDEDQVVKGRLGSVWDDNVGSHRTVVRILTETVEMMEKGLETTQWALRHGAALAVASTAAALVGSRLLDEQVYGKQFRAIWPVMEKALALKTFEGKEKVLEAFVGLVERTEDVWRGDGKLAALQHKIVVREAKRSGSVEYKIAALPLLGRFAKTRGQVDMLAEIMGLAVPGLEVLKEEGVGSGETGEKEVKLARAGVEAIVLGVQGGNGLRERGWGVLGEVLDSVVPLLEDGNLERVRQVWYQGVEPILAAADKQMKNVEACKEAGVLCVRFARSLLLGLEGGAETAGTGTEGGTNTMSLGAGGALTLEVRVDRAKGYEAVVKAVVDGVFCKGLLEMEKQTVVDVGKRLLEEERAMDVGKILREAVAMLE